MHDVIAHMELTAIPRNGEQFRMTVNIGRPYLEGESPPTWACPVSLEPPFGKLSDIRGVDSFHALCLANRLVLALLNSFKAQGGRLVLDDGSDFPLEAYSPFAESRGT